MIGFYSKKKVENASVFTVVSLLSHCLGCCRMEVIAIAQIHFTLKDGKLKYLFEFLGEKEIKYTIRY